MMRAVIFALLSTSCARGAPEAHKQAALISASEEVFTKEVAYLKDKFDQLSQQQARQPAISPKAATNTTVVQKAATAPKPSVTPKSAVTLKSANAPKPVTAPKPAAPPTPETPPKPALASKPAKAPKVVHAVANSVTARPVVQAHLQVVASAPAGAPAAAPAAGPAAGDWRKEYAHTDDPEKLKWKWTTNKPGSYDISKKAPPKFLPIGEGAYQSAEAVAQRTKDSIKDCEEGRWNDCYLKAGNDFTDGHNYKHLEGKFGDAPTPRSGATPLGLGLAVLALLCAALTH